MKYLFFYILILFAIINCQNPDKDFKVNNENLINQDSIDNIALDSHYLSMVEPYTSDTILSNGYHLNYRVYKDYEKDTLNQISYYWWQSLVLMKGNQPIKEINSCSVGLPHKNLGFIEHDFENFFIFKQGFCGDCYRPFQIINKSDGEIILNGFFLGLENNVLLYEQYYNDSVPNQYRIRDFDNNTDYQITYFDNFECNFIDFDYADYCLELDSVSKSSIYISMETTDGLKRKKYQRK